MRFKHLPIVAFDTETTGLNPFDGDRIIEVGIVTLHLDENGEVSQRDDFNHLVNPGIPIPRKVTEITGIRDSDVQNAPTFTDIAFDVQEKLSAGIAVAHNFPFDLAFLGQELRLAGLDWPYPTAEVDTVDLSMKVFPEAGSHKLADLAKRCDVPLENAHRATDDAAACGLALAKLMRRQQLDDDLQALLDWANAIGLPPEDGALVQLEEGGFVFGDGEYEGKGIGDHPLHLQWMLKARRRTSNGWQFRYSEATRRWIKRWLDVRGSGRARGGPKPIHPDAWQLDSAIAT